MSFALSLRDGAYEYAGSGFRGFFGQWRNLARAGHWQLLKDISKFFRTASSRIELYPPATPLGAFLRREGYSQQFISNHILPMGAAIWSTGMDRMLAFPARSFVDFYGNHAMLQFRSRPAWRTVIGGSREYVARLIGDGGFEVRAGNGALRVVRHANYVHIADQRGVMRPFDQVVIATHADQALRLLHEPDALEQRLLGSFSYQTNRAVLHRDARFMPRRKRLWSSWNYLKTGDGEDGSLCVTYWMNRLQNLESETNLFVTLNPPGEIHPKAVEAVCDYDHPVFDAAAVAGQQNLWALQGTRRTWYCGSYFGFGFHEDGTQSGLAVAEQLGGVRRPWRVENESGRISLPTQAYLEAAE